MMAGLPRTSRPRARARRALAPVLGFLLVAAVAAPGWSVAAPAGDGAGGNQPEPKVSPVKRARLSQAGRSLIFQVRTDRQIGLRDLERQPDLDRLRARYLCFEMTRRGSKIVSRICLGGRRNSHHRIGITRAGRTGTVYSKDTVAATVKRSGDRKLVFKIDPEVARLKAGRYGWRVVDADGTCRDDDQECRSAFPAKHLARFRVRPIEVVGCTGGDGQFVTHGSRDRKRIALTFDDGPGPYSSDVLHILKKYDVKSTFFEIGQEVERYPRESRRILARGHELANHTTHHGFYPGAADIGRTNSIIEHATGFRPCLFRPPGGGVSSGVIAAAAQEKVKVVTWDIDTGDWRMPGSGSILSEITHARSGSIVLMHDGGGPRGQTIEALAAGIENLQGRGYELVTVTELLGNEFIYRPR